MAFAIAYTAFFCIFMTAMIVYHNQIADGVLALIDQLTRRKR